MKKSLTLVVLMLAIGFASTVNAATYVMDTKNHHAFIQFKISHLGYSWLLGRFDNFSGSFDYDPANPNASKVSVEIDVASVNSNHAPRDKHLRSAELLDVAKYPKATFVSTGFKDLGNGKAVLTGDFTLHGVTRSIDIDATSIGAGKDPWGGYRQGFEGKVRFALADYGINFNLGPASKEVEMYLSIEGIRQ